MPDDKLSEDEKDSIKDAFKDASLSDIDLEKLAEGVDDAGETVLPVETGEDMLSAAALALEFVEGLETPESRADAAAEEGAVAGFDALLHKLETLRGDISSLQRGVVGVFAAQLLTFRGKVVELKSRISEEMVEKLRMQFFKSFIETTFVDIVDNEFAALEKDLVDKIVEQTQERFKEFAQRVRESEMGLRSAIVEQQDIVRSFMTSLEEDTISSQTVLSDKQVEISKLEIEIRSLQSKLDESKSIDAATEEFTRKVADLETEVSTLKQDIFKKDELVASRTQEAEEAKKNLQELEMKLGETQSELDVYKSEEVKATASTAASDAEIESLQSKLALIEATLEEKRTEADTHSSEVKDLELQLSDLIKEKKEVDELAQSRLKELDGVQDKIAEVKNLEERIYDLEQELKETEAKIPILEMQKEAFEKATRLMEKERDMSLEQRDIADERTKRYIKVLGMEANTKVLLLVDEVGSIAFTELGKSLGVPTGLATKHARELEKLGVLSIKGNKAISTVKKFEVKEGEVDVENEE
ncbi:MAG: hypothetical protein ACW97A_04990 [Candidatus Thorarchaeota archaeon]|jgi:chromosome segregation ATPase